MVYRLNSCRLFWPNINITKLKFYFQATEAEENCKVMRKVGDRVVVKVIKKRHKIRKALVNLFNIRMRLSKFAGSIFLIKSGVKKICTKSINVSSTIS